MAVIVQQKRIAETYLVPAGGEILWYGTAANIPSSFTLDSYMANVFVRGASAGGASNTINGAVAHTHTNPASTGEEANHTHAVGAPSVQGASGDENTYGAHNGYYADAGHGHGGSATTSGAGGIHTHTLSSTASGDQLPFHKKLYLIKATVDSEFPVGGIVMLNAAIANRPLKTELCNGANGTLDLRTFFVLGAANDGEIGTQGGAATHVHANSSTGSAGAHTHTTSPSISNTGDNTQMASGYAGTSVSEGGHGHSWSQSTNSDAAHTHTIPNTGTASNYPPYLKLYFVMRTV